MTATRPAGVDVHQLVINTIRFLAVDMVERADSGHPGTPMAQAPLAYLLWTRHLRHNPKDPSWPDRDRFVLSCGHASALLYALLHLAGFEDMTRDELERFRQLGSRTPGHPEHGHAAGVETTTGPLGQGVGNAVGMAIAEAFLAARFNRPGFPLVDHRVWCLASDGDMMEGVASEASSLAGHLGLAKLTVFYDDNRITIDGSTDLAFSEDVGRRYEAYGWHVQRVEDANDLDALERAITAARAEARRPSLVVFRSHIAFGSPGKQDTPEAHGAPLGADEVLRTKENLGWPADRELYIPEEAHEAFAAAREQGARAQARWEEMAARYRREHPEAAEEVARWRAGELPDGWEEALDRLSFGGEKPVATRSASGKCLQALAERLPNLLGGSADLASSNKTVIEASGSFSATDRTGRNLHFGVREHAMGAIANGIALSGGLRPFASTFLIFSDYMRPAIRLGALMGLPVVYVFTHDSIFLGEDGPTHQPISQLPSLRAIPGLTVLRPADAWETVEAWRLAVANRRGPTALALTRQNVPVLAATRERAREGVPRGAYVLAEAEDGEPHVLLIASGSEVALALAGRELLAARGVRARVVSMPSWELFAAQDRAYRDAVLPPAVTARLAVEAGSPLGWERWVGPSGGVLGVERFGASAPWKDLAREYGFTPEEVARRAAGILDRR